MANAILYMYVRMLRPSWYAISVMNLPASFGCSTQNCQVRMLLSLESCQWWTQCTVWAKVRLQVSLWTHTLCVACPACLQSSVSVTGVKTRKEKKIKHRSKRKHVKILCAVYGLLYLTFDKHINIHTAKNSKAESIWSRDKYNICV